METLHFTGDGSLVIAEENDVGILPFEDAPSAEGGVAWYNDEIGIEIRYRFRAFLVGIFRRVVFQYGNDHIERDDDDEFLTEFLGFREEVSVSVVEAIENAENHAGFIMWSVRSHKGCFFDIDCILACFRLIYREFSGLFRWVFWGLTQHLFRAAPKVQ